MEQGRPIYFARETVDSFRPSYLKPKDNVMAHQMMPRRAGFP